MSSIKVIAIAAIAVVTIASMLKQKPAPEAKPATRKLSRKEAHDKVMEFARNQGGSKEYVEAMDLMGNAVDFNNIYPMYERV